MNNEINYPFTILHEHFLTVSGDPNKDLVTKYFHDNTVASVFIDYLSAGLGRCDKFYQTVFFEHYQYGRSYLEISKVYKMSVFELQLGVISCLQSINFQRFFEWLKRYDAELEKVPVESSDTLYDLLIKHGGPITVGMRGAFDKLTGPIDGFGTNVSIEALLKSARGIRAFKSLSPSEHSALVKQLIKYGYNPISLYTSEDLLKLIVDNIVCEYSISVNHNHINDRNEIRLTISMQVPTDQDSMDTHNKLMDALYKVWYDQRMLNMKTSANDDKWLLKLINLIIQNLNAQGKNIMSICGAPACDK